MAIDDTTTERSRFRDNLRNVGLIFALIGGSPVQAIVFAQATNGILLPIVAVFLLIVMNRSDLLGRYANTSPANVLGVIVVLVAAGLGAAR